MLVVALLVSFVWMLFIPQEAAGRPTPGPGRGPAGSGPDTESPPGMWRRPTPTPAERPAGELDDDELDFGDMDRATQDPAKRLTARN